MTKTLAPPKQKCRRCNGELAHDEKRNCMFCPICYPPNRTQPSPPKEKPKLVDVAMTEERVREIVRDELENWHIRKPPVTKTEVEELTISDTFNQKRLDTMSWRLQAKELGIELYHRTKADVLAEIETRLSGSKQVPTDGEPQRAVE